MSQRSRSRSPKRLRPRLPNIPIPMLLLRSRALRRIRPAMGCIVSRQHVHSRGRREGGNMAAHQRGERISMPSSTSPDESPAPREFSQSERSCGRTGELGGDAMPAAMDPRRSADVRSTTRRKGETAWARDARVAAAPTGPLTRYLGHAVLKSGRNPLSIAREYIRLSRGRGRISPREYVQFGVYDPSLSDDEKSRFLSEALHWPIAYRCNDHHVAGGHGRQVAVRTDHRARGPAGGADACRDRHHRPNVPGNANDPYRTRATRVSRLPLSGGGRPSSASPTGRSGATAPSSWTRPNQTGCTSTERAGWDTTPVLESSSAPSPT